MRIVYSPFIDQQVQLESCDGPDLDGNMTIQGKVKGKSARLVLDIKEAAKLFEWLKDADVENVAKLS